MLQTTTLALVTPLDQLGLLLLETAIFSLLGLLLFGLAFWLIVKVTPFSIRQELEHDHNTALAIVIGAVIIGIAIIVASAING
jgi:putative membrane protein